LRRINAYAENGIDCPTIILTGSEDGSHERALALKARISNFDLKVLPGADGADKEWREWRQEWRQASIY